MPTNPYQKHPWLLSRHETRGRHDKASCQDTHAKVNTRFEPWLLYLSRYDSHFCTSCVLLYSGRLTVAALLCMKDEQKLQHYNRVRREVTSVGVIEVKATA